MWKIYKHIFPNNKIYIGQTKQKLKDRFHNGEGYCKCPLVYKAIKKYGWENVITEIIEDNIPTLELANQKEQHYIQLYNAYNPEYGYNIAVGGGIVNRANYEEIYNYWQQGYNIKEIAEKLEYDRNTVSKALDEYNVSKEERSLRKSFSISKAERKFDRKLIYKAWLECPDYSLLKQKFNCSIDVIRRALIEHNVSETIRRNNGKEKQKTLNNSCNRKKINQYDLDNNYLRSFNSIAEANLFLGKAKNASNIVQVCKGKRKTAYGFKWSYAN